MAESPEENMNYYDYQNYETTDPCEYELTGYEYNSEYQTTFNNMPCEVNALNRINNNLSTFNLNGCSIHSMLHQRGMDTVTAFVKKYGQHYMANFIQVCKRCMS